VADIVQQLRHPEGLIEWSHSVLMDNAADEIERLRAVNRELEMRVAIEMDMAADERMADEEREAQVWVHPRPPKVVINIKPGKELAERYGGDTNAWGQGIAETIKRELRNGEAHRV
jgi:hypothetical protein